MATQHPSVDATGQVISTDEVAQGFYLTRLQIPGLVAGAQPGQFVQVRVRPRRGVWPYLRLPLSVAAADASAGTIDVLYEVVGPKTGALQRLRPGDEVACLGPLGNAFPAPAAGRQPLLVGGGIGVPPLVFLGTKQSSAGHEPRLLVGARTAAKHLPDQLLVPAATARQRATDDGSLGHAGSVTDLLTRCLDEAGVDWEVFTCGPHEMMAAVAALCVGHGVTCHASLEEYMACGFGVCVGCVVELRDGETTAGPYGRYARACVDGPVFDAARVVW